MRRSRRPGVTAAASAAAPAPTRASVDLSTIRDRFNWDWAMTQDQFTEADTYWWYAVSIRVDPSEVIADDGEGNLWSIPFTTDGADQITFQTPVRVRETYVPVAAADGVAATAAVSRRRQQVLATNLDRPEKPGRDNPAAASADEPDQEESTMDEDVRQVLVRQGLDPETATEDQINAANVFVAAGIVPPAADDEPETPAAETDTEETSAGTPEPVAASERVVTVDREQWEATQRDAQAGAAARAAQVASERDQLVSAAVSDGRIAPSSYDAWRQALDARPDTEAAALAALTPGRIPKDERGSSNNTATADAGYDRVAASMGVKPRKES